MPIKRKHYKSAYVAPRPPGLATGSLLDIRDTLKGFGVHPSWTNAASYNMWMEYIHDYDTSYDPPRSHIWMMNHNSATNEIYYSTYKSLIDQLIKSELLTKSTNSLVVAGSPYQLPNPVKTSDTIFYFEATDFRWSSLTNRWTYKGLLTAVILNE
jgi:hypothetical protein